MLSGDSLCDSIVSYHACLFDPLSPTTGSSRDSDSLVPFLCSLVGVATLSLELPMHFHRWVLDPSVFFFF